MGKSKKKKKDKAQVAASEGGDVFNTSLAELKQALNILGFDVVPKTLTPNNMVSSPITDIIKESRKRKLSVSSNAETESSGPHSKKHKHNDQHRKPEEIGSPVRSNAESSIPKFNTLHSTPTSTRKVANVSFLFNSQSSSSDLDFSLAKLSPLTTNNNLGKKHKDKKIKSPKKDASKQTSSQSQLNINKSGQKKTSSQGKASTSCDWTRKELAAVDATKLNLLEKYFVGKNKDVTAKVKSPKKQKVTETSTKNTVNINQPNDTQSMSTASPSKMLTITLPKKDSRPNTFINGQGDKTTPEVKSHKKKKTKEKPNKNTVTANQPSDTQCESTSTDSPSKKLIITSPKKDSNIFINGQGDKTTPEVKSHKKKKTKEKANKNTVTANQPSDNQCESTSTDSPSKKLIITSPKKVSNIFINEQGDKTTPEVRSHKKKKTKEKANKNTVTANQLSDTQCESTSTDSPSKILLVTSPKKDSNTFINEEGDKTTPEVKSHKKKKKKEKANKDTVTQCESTSTDSPSKKLTITSPKKDSNRNTFINEQGDKTTPEVKSHKKKKKKEKANKDTVTQCESTSTDSPSKKLALNSPKNDSNTFSNKQGDKTVEEKKGGQKRVSEEKVSPKKKEKLSNAEVPQVNINNAVSKSPKKHAVSPNEESVAVQQSKKKKKSKKHEEEAITGNDNNAKNHSESLMLHQPEEEVSQKKSHKKKKKKSSKKTSSQKLSTETSATFKLSLTDSGSDTKLTAKSVKSNKKSKEKISTSIGNSSSKQIVGNSGKVEKDKKTKTTKSKNEAKLKETKQNTEQAIDTDLSKGKKKRKSSTSKKSVDKLTLTDTNSLKKAKSPAKKTTVKKVTKKETPKTMIKSANEIVEDEESFFDLFDFEAWEDKMDNVQHLLSDGTMETDLGLIPIKKKDKKRKKKKKKKDNLKEKKEKL
ncbi:uncharacterized protein [Antedon mediterranea]|uniref:uncharacterized protein n=1 Tax=Antedon mediterranea TaxID=105859 RepID=UPI003AF88582